MPGWITIQCSLWSQLLHIPGFHSRMLLKTFCKTKYQQGVLCLPMWVCFFAGTKEKFQSISNINLPGLKIYLLIIKIVKLWKQLDFPTCLLRPFLIAIMTLAQINGTAHLPRGLNWLSFILFLFLRIITLWKSYVFAPELLLEWV